MKINHEFAKAERNLRKKHLLAWSIMVALLASALLCLSAGIAYVTVHYAQLSAPDLSTRITTAALSLLLFVASVLSFAGVLLMQLLAKRTWGEVKLAQMFAACIERYVEPVWQAMIDISRCEQEVRDVTTAAEKVLEESGQLKREAKALCAELNPKHLADTLLILTGANTQLRHEYDKLAAKMDAEGAAIMQLEQTLPAGYELLEEMSELRKRVEAFLSDRENVVPLRAAE